MGKKQTYKHSSDWVTIDLQEKPGTAHIAGNITSSEFSAEIIVCVCDKTEEYHFNYACIAMAPTSNLVVMLLETPIYEGLKAQDPGAVFAVLHEVGHYVNGDLHKTLEEKSSLYERRTTLLKDGKVSEKEIKADAFAFRYLGGNIAYQGMEELKDMIAHLSEDAELSLFELEKRMESVSMKYVK